MSCSIVSSYSASRNDILFTSQCAFFTYIQNVHTIRIPAGTWKFELWGAASGLSSYTGPSAGLGAYVSGVIVLKNEITLYGYVGGKGGNSTVGTPGEAGFNGGGKGGSDDVDTNCASPGGGGSSDLRINQNDLYSRIIVAAGGGSPGCGRQAGSGGAGGTIEGIPGYPNERQSLKGGSGGHFDPDRFGIGEEGAPGNEASGAGGGGYFGGYTGEATPTAHVHGSGGGGGSSYVSGCKNCSTLLPSNSSNGSFHPSKIVFKNIEMYPGNEQIKTYIGAGLSYTPHESHGCIRISKYNLYDILPKPFSILEPFSFHLSLLYIFTLCI